MTVSVKVRNKDRLYSALRASVPNLDVELRKALADAGDDMVAKAKQFVPVDQGDLRDSLKWEWTRATQADENRSPAIVIQGGGDTENDDAFYIRWVEFGRKGAGGMAPRPFFFPAYRLMRRAMRSRMSRAMTRAIKKAGLVSK